jgi:hypothetical protein
MQLRPSVVSYTWIGNDIIGFACSFRRIIDPHFEEKLADVVGLYIDPPDNAVVLSVDE